MMVVPLVGWHVAGFSGVLVTCSPARHRLWSPALRCGSGNASDRPWRKTVQAGLVPVTAGLVTASAIVITHASVSSWGTILIAAGVAIATTTTRIHPLLALAAGVRSASPVSANPDAGLAISACALSSAMDAARPGAMLMLP